MPPQAPSDARLNNIVTHLKSAVELLNNLHDAIGTPLLPVISSLVLSLTTSIQSVKRNLDECVNLLEGIHSVLYAIFDLHIKSAGGLPPGMLEQLGYFTETLPKINVYIEAQQENKFKNLFRQGETNRLRKDCWEGLQQVMDKFKIKANATLLASTEETRETTERMHQELLELISTVSDGTISVSEKSSNFISKGESSGSFSMIPAQPKIFYGRDSEITEILDALSQSSPRVAILGGGGMGKTTLAKTVLHHPALRDKYEHRYFVSADSATTDIELAGQIALHLGLRPGKNLTKPVLRHLANAPPCLLILDNLETSWEPLESRKGIEELLSLLSDVEHLALIITMRGAERPTKVRWTRPFLLPLAPLSQDAAQKIFMDIADESHNSDDMQQLLRVTDNMPLAVTLVAHLVDYEGCASVLARWEEEKTALLSDGYDKRSNLDASITISLLSPRMRTSPGAQELSSLLSILPDGLSEGELIQSRLPIQDIRRCRATLLGTSLAYNDTNHRLKSLAPIREHIQTFCPPSEALIQALGQHYHSRLKLYRKYYGMQQMGGIMNETTLNFSNITQVLRRSLNDENPDLSGAIRCTIAFNGCSRISGYGGTGLLDHIPPLLPRAADRELDALFITEAFNSHLYRPVVDPERLIDEGISHFLYFNNPALEGRFYKAVGDYHRTVARSSAAAMHFFKKGLAISRLSGNAIQESSNLNGIAELECYSGNYHSALNHVREAQRLARLAGDSYREALSLRVAGLCSRFLGDFKNAIVHLQKARELLKVCGIPGGNLQQITMNDEAQVHLLKSEYAEAREIHSQLVHTISADRDPAFYASSVLNFAEIGVITGVPTPEVQHHLDRGKALCQNPHHPTGLMVADVISADLHLREGDTSAAKALFHRCVTAMRGVSNELVSYSLERLADGTRWSNANHDYASWTVVYLAHGYHTAENLALLKGLIFLGDIFLSQRDNETATSLFQIALEGFTSMDVHRSRAQCLVRLGDIAEDRGDIPGALELWKRARELFERSLQDKEITGIDSRLAANHSIGLVVE
ncbi:hypothetical protein B0H16DRAFT_1416207 [Mycena metata]|uniref:Novel STAND NTPase 1 domain-containing protein n=1 Tax=Mycena metata TaxID=1033252 RepID=A0AAD7J936_9AGAR|nr:hypothetical protein B0H16DRAFT_1416207 [Mycena metata]